MTPTIALAAAGPDAVLVRRPRGVLHVYVGPLTPSGAAVPLAARAVCRTRTRRLTVAPPSGRSTRVCARCTACLFRHRRAVQPRNRRDVAARFTSLTAVDLLAAAEAARTPAELEHIGHLAIVVLGLRSCLHDQVPGRDRPLVTAIAHHRRRVAGFPETFLVRRDAENREVATARRRADRAEARRLNDARIDRLGFINATRR